MTREEIMKAAFLDELEKISGELQGFTRSGRKPIGIEKMLENETEQELPSEVFQKSSSPIDTIPAKYKTLGLLGAGAGIYHVGRKAEQDRRLGRAMRLQQGQGY